MKQFQRFSSQKATLFYSHSISINESALFSNYFPKLIPTVYSAVGLSAETCFDYGQEKLDKNFNFPQKYYCGWCNSNQLPLKWKFSIEGLTDQETSNSFTPCSDYNGNWVLTYDTSKSWYRSQIDFNCIWPNSTQVLAPCIFNRSGREEYGDVWALHYRNVYRAWTLETVQNCNVLRYEIPFESRQPGPAAQMDCAEIMTFQLVEWGPCTEEAPQFIDIEPYGFVINEVPLNES